MDLKNLFSKSVTNVLPLSVIGIREYVDAEGRIPFRKWFDDLNVTAAAKVTAGLSRIERGNLSNVKSVGNGVMEYRIDFGPGYRIYFGKDGEQWVILLAGGTKKRQQLDIEAAVTRWKDYKRRKGTDREL